MLAPLGLVEAELGAPGDDVHLVLHIALQRLHQVEGARHTVDESHHVDREAGLQLGELVEVVEHHVGVGVSFQRDHQVGLAPGRAVVHVGDAVEVAAVHQLLDPPGDGRAAGLVGQFGDDDLHLPAPALLDGGGSPHLDAAPAGAIGVEDPGPAEDAATGGEVRALHELHEVVGAGPGVVDEVDGGVDDLAEVVRRDAGGHADRDALAAVDQQVREAGRQHRRLLGGVVVVGQHVDGVLVDVRQHLHRQRVQPALGVTLSGRSEVWGSVVSVEVDQWVAQAERLRHAHQRVVDGRVAVGVVLGHRVAGDAGALDVGPVGAEALLIHVPDDPAVHRLQAVAHIGQGAGHDDRHRVVDEAALHLVLQLDRLDGVAGAVGPVGAVVLAVGGGSRGVTHSWCSAVSALRSPGCARRGRWW